MTDNDGTEPDLRATQDIEPQDVRKKTLEDFARWVSESETPISFSKRHCKDLPLRKVEEFWDQYTDR